MPSTKAKRRSGESESATQHRQQEEEKSSEQCSRWPHALSLSLFLFLQCVSSMLHLLRHQWQKKSKFRRLLLFLPHLYVTTLHPHPSCPSLSSQWRYAIRHPVPRAAEQIASAQRSVSSTCGEMKLPLKHLFIPHSLVIINLSSMKHRSFSFFFRYATVSEASALFISSAPVRPHVDTFTLFSSLLFSLSRETSTTCIKLTEPMHPLVSIACTMG